MGWFSALDSIGNLFDNATDIAKEAITDKDKALEVGAALKKAKIEANMQMIQSKHDEIMGHIKHGQLEVKSNDAYVRRARPTILWICGAALGYNFVIHPLLCWGLTVSVVFFPEAAAIEPPPLMSVSELMPALLGLLGLSSMRTVERIKGKS